MAEKIPAGSRIEGTKVSITYSNLLESFIMNVCFAAAANNIPTRCYLGGFP
jgi:hypothetical protein